MSYQIHPLIDDIKEVNFQINCSQFELDWFVSNVDCFIGTDNCMFVWFEYLINSSTKSWWIKEQIYE